MEKREIAENFIETLLCNFDKKYQKRVLRYYYRTIRKLRSQLNKKNKW